MPATLICVALLCTASAVIFCLLYHLEDTRRQTANFQTSLNLAQQATLTAHDNAREWASAYQEQTIRLQVTEAIKDDLTHRLATTEAEVEEVHRELGEREEENDELAAHLRTAAHMLTQYEAMIATQRTLGYIYWGKAPLFIAMINVN